MVNASISSRFPQTIDTSGLENTCLRIEQKRGLTEWFPSRPISGHGSCPVGLSSVFKTILRTIGAGQPVHPDATADGPRARRPQPSFQPTPHLDCPSSSYGRVCSSAVYITVRLECPHPHIHTHNTANDSEFGQLLMCIRTKSDLWGLSERDAAAAAAAAA